MDAPRRVAVVKSAGRADAFAEAIRAAGFLPVLVSPFREEPVDDAGSALAAAVAALPKWIAATSPHAVRALVPHAPALGGVRLAAVGSGTASAMHSAGLVPEIVGDAGGEALARRMLGAGLAAGDLVVHPCAEDARRELADTLGAAGAVVRSVAVYRMVRDPVGERAAEGEFFAVVVGSPRLAERAAELFPGRPPVVAVGRTTAQALRDLGWRPAHVAATPSPADVAGALAQV